MAVVVDVTYTYAKRSVSGFRVHLVHVKVALQDAFLHGIGNLGLLRHLANRRLHDSHALGALMLVGMWRVHVCARDGGSAFGASAEVLCKIVAFACIRKNRSQFVFAQSLARIMFEMLGEYENRRRRRRRIWKRRS